MRRAFALVLLASALWPAPAAVAAPRFRLLVYTRTAGYRHASIPAAIRALRRLAAANGFALTVTESPLAFRERRLRRFRVVAFVLTTGDVLDGAGRFALARFVARGGGFVGVHSASDTEHRSAAYRALVGAEFRAHAPVQPALLVTRDRRDPSTRLLARRFRAVDEWYAFTADPSPHVHVLLAVDETSYRPGSAGMGASHPLAWCHRVGAGRAWYTALGHTAAQYRRRFFLRHLLGGVLWAARAAPGCGRAPSPRRPAARR